MKKISIIIITILLLGIGCNQTRQTNETKKIESNIESNDYIAEVDNKLIDVNFSEMGNITNWEESSGEYVEQWAFTYEKPGSPAIKVDLIINNDSTCVISKEEYSCGEILTKEFNGKRLYVQGIRDVNEVTVKRITF